MTNREFEFGSSAEMPTELVRYSVGCRFPILDAVDFWVHSPRMLVLGPAREELAFFVESNAESNLDGQLELLSAVALTLEQVERAVLIGLDAEVGCCQLYFISAHRVNRESFLVNLCLELLFPRFFQCFSFFFFLFLELFQFCLLVLSFLFEACLLFFINAIIFFV